MKKIFTKILLLIVPFAVLAMAINYVVDAGNVFSKGVYEKQIANILLQKKNAMGMENFDDRLVFETIVKNLDTLPNTAVIGTSRTLILQQKNFDSTPFRNLGMAQSNINDIVAQIGLFDSLNKFPKTLYIEVLSMYHSYKEDGTKWWTLSQYHKHLVHKLKLKNIDVIESPKWFFMKRKMNALFSLDYFQNNIANYKKAMNKKVIAIDDENKMTDKGRYWDGSISYEPNKRNIDTLKVMGNVEIFVKNEGYPKADENKMEIMVKLISFLKTKKVNVKLLMLPYQIDTYKAFEQSKSLTYFTQTMKQFSSQNKVDLIGTFNPEEANIGRKYFYDPAHCSPLMAKNILQIVQYKSN